MNDWQKTRLDPVTAPIYGGAGATQIVGGRGNDKPLDLGGNANTCEYSFHLVADDKIFRSAA